ncbi:MAG TPA: hypothetical protein PK961_08145 [bacterium]|nr:hypothetical protein [bacterium]
MKIQSLNEMFALILLIAFPLIILTSCAADSESDTDRGTVADNDDDDDDNDDDDASLYNVLERENLGGQYEDDPGADVDDYLDFIQQAAEYADPISQDEIWQQMNEIDAGNVDLVGEQLSADDLRNTIAETLNIEFLLNGINKRLLVVTTIAIDETDAYVQRHLLFEDPWVGVFEGYLLTPKGDGPFPGVVAIHGHFDDAAVYRDDYHGYEYPAHGFAILMLTMRAMDCDQNESDISLALLTNGFTLMGLRVYETLLGVKYLRYLPAVPTERIGLIGHSGGSAASNLTVRLDAEIGAYVSDLDSDYAEWWPELDFIHCETIPELYPYHEHVNDYSTSATPILSVPYGYENGMAEIFSFFEQTLH